MSPEWAESGRRPGWRVGGTRPYARPGCRDEVPTVATVHPGTKEIGDMRTSRFFNVRRVRGLVAALALGGVVTVAAPVAASAYQGYGATLQPNTAACVQQYATTQVRGEGTATRQGAFFTLRYSGQYPGLGAAIATSQVGTTSGWAAESRPWLGNF